MSRMRWQAHFVQQHEENFLYMRGPHHHFHSGDPIVVQNSQDA